MGTLQALEADINNYPNGNVDIEISLLPVPTSPGEPIDSVINVGETREFVVKVDNGGNLHMKDLRLEIEGSKWADVATSDAGPFRSTFVTATQDVNARSSASFGPFALKATKKTNNGAKKLVKANIHTYDANLLYILEGLSHEATVPEAALSHEVFPS